MSFVLFFAISAAEARTLYVAADGVNTIGGSNNNCQVSASPCQTLVRAISAADPGDTIVCISTPMTSSIVISKSITIDCSAARVELRDSVVTTSDATTLLYISIPSASADPLRTVRLRGVTIDGATLRTSLYPTGRVSDRGIHIDSALAVYLDDCVIANVNKQGIFDARTDGQTRLYIRNSVISGSGGPAIVAASQSPASTVLENVSLLNNAYGVAAASGNNVVITRSTISGNTTAGVHADQGAQINVLNSVLSHNTANINAYGTVRLQENAIQFSNVAIQGSAAVSVGGNRFLGNAAPGSTPTAASNAPADVVN